LDSSRISGNSCSDGLEFEGGEASPWRTRATSRRWTKPPGMRRWPGRPCFVGWLARNGSAARSYFLSAHRASASRPSQAASRAGAMAGRGAALARRLSPSGARNSPRIPIGPPPLSRPSVADGAFYRRLIDARCHQPSRAGQSQQPRRESHQLRSELSHQLRLGISPTPLRTGGQDAESHQFRPSDKRRPVVRREK
jgi:hypothetical protein